MHSKLVDSHCHLDRLDLQPFGGSLDGVIEAAAENGVVSLLCVGISRDSLPDVLEIARRYPNVSASVGVHPNEEEDALDEDELLRLSDVPDVVAIGETGLDYFRSEGDLEWQRARFRTHIRAARRAGKPLIVHSREAREDTIRIMQEERADEAGGIMHCFVEDWETARRAIELGFYISFSGIITFNSARELREVAKQVPDDRLLVETDSPYLAPVPKRGKPNYPAYVLHVAERIAKERGVDLESVARRTTENYRRLFPSAG
ncbi:TatD family hydrolase [Thiohalomonas denitrificans]|uniref:TatD family hydrolase n=1 Tax=Thiohalomonas denitrificans TaxID=415747 RepID=UPI0026EF0591|nr:TatD family hydrolase [Thiohalomonas denitrificans]